MISVTVTVNDVGIPVYDCPGSASARLLVNLERKDKGLTPTSSPVVVVEKVGVY